MFINHIFATSPELPPMGAHLYEYVVGANGVFVRARRLGLEALIWVAATAQPVRGLAEVEPYVRLHHLVNEPWVNTMLTYAISAGQNEILFYLSGCDPWQMSIPEQIAGGASVRPSDPYAGGADTILEVHSHHHMDCFFSGTDDQDESSGFRLFAVLGCLDRKPAILTRVGIFGHFWEIPASWIFEMPEGLEDALYAMPEPPSDECEKVPDYEYD